MEGVKFHKKPKLNNPYLIVAWPGMGEVAFKAASYLVDKLKAEEFAQMSPEDFFYLTASVVEDGILNAPELAHNKFYYWKNPAAKHYAGNFGGKLSERDLIIFISNAQPDLTKAQGYCKRIIDVAKNFNVKLVISFAAMPQAIDHVQPSKLWFAATSKETKEILAKYHLQLLSEGQISGMNGLFLGLAKREGLEGFCLLGEIPLYTIQIENPKASAAILEALSRVLNIQIDLRRLSDEVNMIENEINKLLDYLKLGPSLGPIGEEDIEKIKKSLTQLTKLPVSIKENIEALFAQAKADISKANELKRQLDAWNVYKEYEDRFLDLFKKKREENN